MPARRSQRPSDSSSSPSNLVRRPIWLILAAIVVVGALLRLLALRHTPPGLNQDEAANAWNAYCLLKTGVDQHGVRWPIFYGRFFGGYSSMLYIYWMIPFEAIGGLNVWTVRLPSAVAGILTIPLIYYVGARMWNQPVGLVAAALLALTPWHIQQCRWGHEASIVPLLICVTLAAMLWAGLPLANREPRRPKPWTALLAGLIAGISCYGYPSVRLFLPMFLALDVLVTWRGWYSLWKQGGRGRRAIILFVAGGAATFGPLAYKHVTDAEHISRRLAGTRVWSDQDSAATRFVKMLARYPAHFGPSFLFLEGEEKFKLQSPPGGGMLGVYMIPLLVIGLFVVLWRVRTSSADRVLLAWLVVYPLGDCVSAYTGPHALRSLPGLGGLVLLGALGAVEGWHWLRNKHRVTAWAATGVLGLAVVGLSVRFVYLFFIEYPKQPPIYHVFQTDLVEACDWLKPRVNDYDAIFWTVDGLNMPYMITLVVLGYDPRQWLVDHKDMGSDGTWDYCLRYGKMRFLYGPPIQDDIEALRTQNPRARLLFVLRPDTQPPGAVIHQIIRPDGTTVVRISEVRL